MYVMYVIHWCMKGNLFVSGKCGVTVSEEICTKRKWARHRKKSCFFSGSVRGRGILKHMPAIRRITTFFSRKMKIYRYLSMINKADIRLGVWPSARRYIVQTARLNYTVKSQTFSKKLRKKKIRPPSSEPTAKIS